MTGAGTIETYVSTTLVYAGAFTGIGTFTKSGDGIFQRATNALSLGGAFTVSAGVYDANALAGTITGLTTVSGGTYTASTATQTFNGGLAVSGGTFTGSAGDVDVNGDVDLSLGILTAPSGAFTVSGDWSKSGGTFTPGSGTVTLDGADQTVSGTTTFNNLTKVNLLDDSNNETLTFESGTTTTMDGVLTIDGLDGNDRVLIRATGGSAATVDFQGSSSFTGDYLNIQNGTVTDNSSAVSLPINPANSTDAGGNTGWFFPAASVAGGAENGSPDDIAKLLREMFGPRTHGIPRRVSDFLEEDGASDFVFNRDRTLRYTANALNNTVTVTEVQTGRVIKSLRTGRMPFRLALSGDETRLFVYARLDSTISKINIATGESEAVVEWKRFCYRLRWTEGSGLEAAGITGETAVVFDARTGLPARGNQ